MAEDRKQDTDVDLRSWVAPAVIESLLELETQSSGPAATDIAQS